LALVSFFFLDLAASTGASSSSAEAAGAA